MDDREKSAKRSSVYQYIGLIPVLVLIVLITILYLISPTHPITRKVFEPPLLVFILNTVFLFLAPCAVSYMAIKSYLLAGSFTVLFLGCGALTLGTGSLLAGWLIGHWGQNVLVTTHNASALLAAIFYMVGIIANVTEKNPEADPTHRRRQLAAAYLGVIIFVILVSLAAVRGLTPPFFIKEVGPTPIRQFILGIAILLFVISSSSMMIRFVEKSMQFLYWYSLALALLALGMGGIFLQPAVGSPIGWVARIAQYLSGIYLIMALVSAGRMATAQGTAVSDIVADIFRQSERKIAAILGSMTDCHYELDREWRFTRINDRALAYFGKQKEDFIGRTFWDVMSVPSGSAFEQQYRKALREGAPAHFDLPSDVVLGKWAEIHAYPTEDGLSVYFRDITERKQAEEAISRSEKTLSELIERAPFGIYVVNSLFRIAQMNVSSQNGSFRNVRPLIGRDFTEAMHTLWPEPVAAEIIAKFRHTLETGEPFYSPPFVNPRHDVDIVESYEWELHRLMLPDGQYGVICYYFDSTRLIMAQEALRKARDELELRVQERTQALRQQTEALSTSEKEFRMLAEAMPQIVWITRADGWNIYFNQQWVDYTGLTLEESYGHGWNKPFHPDDRQRAWDAWQNAVTNNGTYSLECRLRAVDGTYRWWLVRGVPVVNEKGETTKWFGTCTDIEEFKRVEDQLRQSQKMEAIGTLAGGIAHDFNNILAAILGFTEMAIEDAEGRPEVTGSLQNVLKASMRARDLVKQILAFSRKTNYERAPLSLSPLVKETVQLLRASVPSTIEIRLDIASSWDHILAAPVEIQQILMNLATNASLAMQENGGTLEMTLTDIDFTPDSPVLEPDVMPGEYLQLIVKDTGVGMNHDVMKRVFEPFFTTREVGNGTGMGLAVVYGIVKDLQGTITVESTPGVGSTFRVLLPKIQAEALKEDADRVRTSGGTERILFIDDEEMLVEWGRATLEKLGYKVTAMTDGKEALNAFSSDPSQFDLVITDHTMPNITGLQFAKELLKIKHDIPIILCTGHSETVSPDITKEAGIKEYLMKPLAKQELAEVVRRVLDEK